MPVASANKVPRPRGGTNNTGEGASGKRIIDVERPPATQFGKKMALTFNWLQDEGVPMAKAIAKLRSIYDEALKEGKKGVDEFFLYTSFFLQLPISSGTVKEKVGKADEKTLETICKFGVSFFQVGPRLRNIYQKLYIPCLKYRLMNSSGLNIKFHY